MGLYTSHYACSPLVSALFSSFVRLYVRPRVIGRGHIPGKGPFILVANHASHADTAVITTVLPRKLRRRLVVAAAADYFFDNGLREAVVRTLFNGIPVERKAGPGRDPLRHAARALREGYGLLFFPEGTRSNDSGVGPFRAGLGRLIAMNPGIATIPVWLDTAGRVLPKGSVLPRPYTVTVRFGAPMYLEAERNDRASWQAAADAAREGLIQLSLEEARRAEAPDERAPHDDSPASEQPEGRLHGPIARPRAWLEQLRAWRNRADSAAPATGHGTHSTEESQP